MRGREFLQLHRTQRGLLPSGRVLYICFDVSCHKLKSSPQRRREEAALTQQPPDVRAAICRKS